MAAVGAVEVELPEAPHRGAGEAVALRELVAPTRVSSAASQTGYTSACATGRGTALVAQAAGDHRGEVAARAVAGERDATAVAGESRRTTARPSSTGAGNGRSGASE